MKARFSIAILVMMISLSGCANNWVELDVLVHEEDGAPIDGADIKGSFITDEIDNGVNRDSHADVTNDEGMGRVAGEENLYVDIMVSKAGYYQTNRRKVVNQEKRGLVDILLRPKRNPIALYVKKFTGYIPVNKTEIGFDFLAGDWVGPFGDGVNMDIVFYRL